MQSKLGDFHQIFDYPSQMDISFTEQCNQDCDYCWTNKSGVKHLNLKLIKRAVDIFLDFHHQEQTITFTTNEPLIFPDLYQKTVDYIIRKSACKKVKIITTTNGVLLSKPMRDFIVERLDDNFRLNISLDGNQKSHDAHRKLKANPKRSAFALSWANFKKLPRDKVRVIFTITPGELAELKGNIDFILSNGFKKLDLFPQMFVIWKEKDLSVLKKELRSLVANTFNNHPAAGYDLRILNRLWGDTHYAKLLFGSDGKFYLFEWVLVLPYFKRKKYIIGDTLKGVDHSKRMILFAELFKDAVKGNMGLCLDCKYQRFCAYPLPLFIWARDKQYDFFKYFTNFCSIAKIFIELSREVNSSVGNELDSLKLSRYLYQKA